MRAGSNAETCAAVYIHVCRVVHDIVFLFTTWILAHELVFLLAAFVFAWPTLVVLQTFALPLLVHRQRVTVHRSERQRAPAMTSTFALSD